MFELRDVVTLLPMKLLVFFFFFNMCILSLDQNTILLINFYKQMSLESG